MVAPVVRAISTTRKAPYPPSPVIREIRWAPKESIVRKARGSDTWPLTWADDDALYTAYGDGRGFEPLVPEKLSLGFARVVGPPEDFTGINIRSATGERKGDGARGQKASGMLMVGGVLYLWARNAGNSRLAWSSDHARTWTWCDWRFETSFGCPTFLNFGKDYAGARDGYVYIYSPDGDSAYRAADRMVLARVPKGRIAERGAYEFFKGLGEGGTPLWTRGHRRTQGGLQSSGGMLPLGDQLRCGAEAVSLVPDLAGRGCPIPGRVRDLRRPRAVGAVDDGLLHRGLGRRAGRDVQLPDEMDERRREDGPPGLLRRRLLLGPQGGPDRGRNSWALLLPSESLLDLGHIPDL